MPTTTLPEVCPLHAVPTQEEISVVWDRCDADVSRGDMLLDGNKYEFYDQDSLIPPTETGEDNLEIWRNAPSIFGTQHTPGYSFAHYSKFSSLPLNQLTLSTGATVDPRVLSFRHDTSLPQDSDDFTDPAPYRPYAREFSGVTKGLGFTGVVQPAQSPLQYDFDGESYEQAGFIPSHRPRQPPTPDQRVEITLPGPKTSSLHFIKPSRHLKQRARPSPGDVVVPANMIRLSHACFLGTIPLPDAAFHAPGASISDKTMEVLRRPVPEYRGRTSRVQALSAPSLSPDPQPSPTILQSSVIPGHGFSNPPPAFNSPYLEGTCLAESNADSLEFESSDKSPSTSPPRKKTRYRGK